MKECSRKLEEAALYLYWCYYYYYFFKESVGSFKFATIPD